MRRRPLVRFLSLAALGAAGAAPAHAQVAVLTSTVEERTAAPGERYTGTIVIENSSMRPQAVRLYQTDYRFAANGTSEFEEPGTLARSNAVWITPQTTRVTVPAGARVTVLYVVAVPARDSLRGSYWSTIMVEALAADPAVAGDRGTPAVAVGSVIRYAIQVATHLRTPGTRTVQFERERASSTTSGAAVFDVDVANAGEHAYRPQLWIEVYDADGALNAKARQSRGLLYPGSSLAQHFDLGVLAHGRYKAVLFADTGDDSVFAKQFSISF